MRGKKLIAHRVRVVHESVGGEVGALVVQGDSMLVICGEKTLLELVEVQMEGKKRMTAGEFLRGYQVRSGERLGL